MSIAHKYLIALACWFACPSSFAQEEEDFDIGKASMFYPTAAKLHKVKAAVIVLKYKFPEDWVEGAYHVPFLSLHANMGLSKNFTAEMNLGTVILSNQLTGGFRWRKRVGRKFSFNTGYDIATVFGQLNQAGFKSRVRALIHRPNISFGYRYKGIAFTLQGEVNYVGRVNINIGDNAVSDERNFYNGFSVGIYMEQRLWKDHVVIMGLKNRYTKFNYIAWPAFSSFNRFYNIPEFSLGIVL